MKKQDFENSLHEFKTLDDLKRRCEGVILCQKSKQLSTFTKKELFNILKDYEFSRYFCERFKPATNAKFWIDADEIKKTLVKAMIQKVYINPRPKKEIYLNEKI